MRSRENPAWKELATRELQRARRYAAVLERLIAPDGSFPPIGRSLAYRFGAMQVLAQIALRRTLPEGVTPAQTRAALTACIRRSMTRRAPSTRRMADDRLLRPPARRGRTLHLHWQPLSLFGRTPAPWVARQRSVLGSGC